MWLILLESLDPLPPLFRSQFVATFFTVLYPLVSHEEKLQTTRSLSKKANKSLYY